MRLSADDLICGQPQNAQQQNSGPTERRLFERNKKAAQIALRGLGQFKSSLDQKLTAALNQK